MSKHENSNKLKFVWPHITFVRLQCAMIRKRPARGPTDTRRGNMQINVLTCRNRGASVGPKPLAKSPNHGRGESDVGIQHRNKIMGGVIYLKPPLFALQTASCSCDHLHSVPSPHFLTHITKGATVRATAFVPLSEGAVI